MTMKTILLLIIFLIPLFGAVKSFGYEQIKILFFILSVSLIGFLWILRKPAIKWNAVKTYSALLVDVLFLTSVFGIDPATSFFGREPYFQGWVLYAYLCLFSLLVSQAQIKLEKWALVLCSSAFIVSLLAVKDWVLLNIFSQSVPVYAGRVVSTFGQPNFYAGFLLLSLPFSYYLFKTSTGTSQVKRLSCFGLFSSLISIAGIFVSYSRSAILLGLVLLSLALIDQLKFKLKTGLFLIAAFILMGIFLSVKLSSGLLESEFLKPIQTNNPDLTKESVEKRVYLWPLTFKIALQRPLSGYGLENIGLAVNNYFEKDKHRLFEENLNISPVLISLKELYIDHSHNYILDLLLFSGIFGVLGWLGLLGALFLNLRQKHHGRNTFILTTGLITYLIWVQFQNQSIVQLVYFWLLVGLINRKESFEKEPEIS